MSQVTVLSAAVSAICVDGDWLINLNGESMRLNDLSKEGLGHLEWLFSGVDGSSGLITALDTEIDVRVINPEPDPIERVDNETDEDYLARRFSHGRFDGNINWTTHPRVSAIQWVVSVDNKAIVVRYDLDGVIEFTTLKAPKLNSARSVAWQVTMGSTDCRLRRWSCKAEDRTEQDAIIRALNAADLY